MKKANLFLVAALAADEDAVIHLNGVEAASAQRHSTGYVMVPVSAAGAQALRPGRNLITGRCAQTKGAQAIDVDIVRVQEARQ